MKRGTLAPKSPERSVLIVDDEPYVLSALKRGLLNQGFLLVTAETAREALNILKSQEFQVVVSDYDMPHMRGPEFLEQVRKLQPLAIRVVLTGYSDLKTIHSFIRVGRAMRYLLKPWDLAEIQRTLRECFELFSEAARPKSKA